MLDNILRLKYFTTFIDVQSEKETARLYNRSIGNINICLRRLEEDLGAVLYKRGAKDSFHGGFEYILTPAGEIAYRYGKAYCDIDDAFEREMTALHRQYALEGAQPTRTSAKPAPKYIRKRRKET